MKLKLFSRHEEPQETAQTEEDDSTPDSATSAGNGVRLLVSEAKEEPIYLFLPTKELSDKLKQEADKAGMTMSEFIVSQVQESFLVEDLESGKRDLLQQLNAKEEELRKLKSELARSKERSLNLEHDIQVLNSEEL